MAKLYPPQIGGTIPAFYKKYLSDGSLKPLTIPFIMNKTVSKSEIKGFNLIIKTVANNKIIGNLRVEINSINDLPSWNFTKGEVYFHLAEKDSLWNYLKVGQYYKVQLAYIRTNNEIGIYSSTGIIKFTTAPKVDIENLQFALVNMNENVYIGTYSQKSGDISEKVYSYCFNVYDDEGNLYDTSGEQIHNSFEDENAYSSRDIFTLTKDLIVNKNYYIRYEVKTTNNAYFKSSKYRIMQKESIDPDIDASIQVDLNSENGYVNVRLIGTKDSQGLESPATGSFVLKRGSSKDNYTIWNSILTFRLNGNYPSRWLWRDMTVEHGYHYKYTLQQFNDSGLHSNKLYSNEVYVSFEDSFLYDGNKQLRLQFNPKISSFKSTILETKTNTIGSKYPFIFRNGHVDYKEFPISGLISYLSDDEELFMSKDELFLDNKSIDLTDNNIAAERIFKLKVLDFFNDGKPKLFKSPTEGNYIVRLMNTSMAPNDTVGRMLYTISTTASEVADFSYQSLLENNFIELIDMNNYITRWESVPIAIIDGNTVRPRELYEELLNYSPATSLTFENVMPGSRFELKDSNNVSNIITIGATGFYKVDFGLNITSVKIASSGMTQGNLIYSYESNSSNVFDTIEDILIYDYPLIQLIGENNVIKFIGSDIKTSLLSFGYLRFYKREVETLYFKQTIDSNGNKEYFQNKECTVKVTNFNPQFIYKIHNILTLEDQYVDGRNPFEFLKEYLNTFVLNDSNIDLTETKYYELIEPDKITELEISNGLILECNCQTKELVYSLENKDLMVKTAKDNYINALTNYQKLLWWEEEDDYYYTSDEGYSNEYFKALEQAYNVLNGIDNNGYTLKDIYLIELQKAVEKQKEDLKRYE